MLNTYPCNPFPISSEQLHKGDNEDLQAQINAINDVIAPEFDAEGGTYEIGDKVMYEGKLYEFTSAHETAGEWDPTEVTETTVGDELSSLESGLNNLGNELQLSVRIYGNPSSTPFAVGESGVILKLEKGTDDLGYVVLRPRDFLDANNKPVAIEIYDGGWSQVCKILRDTTN